MKGGAQKAKGKSKGAEKLRLLSSVQASPKEGHEGKEVYNHKVGGSAKIQGWPMDCPTPLCRQRIQMEGPVWVIWGHFLCQHWQDAGWALGQGVRGSDWQRHMRLFPCGRRWGGVCGPTCGMERWAWSPVGVEAWAPAVWQATRTSAQKIWWQSLQDHVPRSGDEPVQGGTTPVLPPGKGSCHWAARWWLLCCRTWQRTMGTDNGTQEVPDDIPGRSFPSWRQLCASEKEACDHATGSVDHARWHPPEEVARADRFEHRVSQQGYTPQTKDLSTMADSPELSQEEVALYRGVSRTFWCTWPTIGQMCRSRWMNWPVPCPSQQRRPWKRQSTWPDISWRQGFGIHFPCDWDGADDPNCLHGQRLGRRQSNEEVQKCSPWLLGLRAITGRSANNAVRHRLGARSATSKPRCCGCRTYSMTDGWSWVGS